MPPAAKMRARKTPEPGDTIMATVPSKAAAHEDLQRMDNLNIDEADLKREKEISRNGGA